MHSSIIFRVLGILLMLFSITLLPPVLVSVLYNDQSIDAFIISFLITFGAGLLIWLPVYNQKQDLRTRDGFLITALFWAVLGLAGSLPFILHEATNLSLVDAVFESISGLTTTGATVITGLDALPQSILFYRQQL
ncbi:MAG: trk system potassium uptake protein TrkH, partial [Kiritimatiellia bacterium]